MSSRIYFDNAGDNVTLPLYNVTLTPQKSCQKKQKKTSVIAAKRTFINEDHVGFFFFNKIEKYITVIYSAV